ncbi:MAG: hypothetical protein NTY25_11145, partial [Planctomycetia bacterium]|nr:hypothetical protein [Planctomycetia bacterium]
MNHHNHDNDDTHDSHDIHDVKKQAAPHAVCMRGITKRFPGVVALEDMSLDVRPGELHAICGENGA